MLLRIAFGAILLATLAETTVHGVHASAQAALHRRALIALHEEFASATTQAGNAVAAAIAAGADPRTVMPVAPSPIPTCRFRSMHGCMLQGVATISFTVPVVNPSSQPSPCPDGGCTRYDQGNDSVDEGRISATVSAAVITMTGAPLARHDAYVKWRTWRTAPYVTLADISGAENPTIETGANLGDDGGAVPSSSAPGTLIEVLYENAITKRTLAADVWQARVLPTSAPPPPWSR